MKYILTIDQSTFSTKGKVFIIDEEESNMRWLLQVININAL